MRSVAAIDDANYWEAQLDVGDAQAQPVLTFALSGLYTASRCTGVLRLGDPGDVRPAFWCVCDPLYGWVSGPAAILPAFYTVSLTALGRELTATLRNAV